MKKILLSLIAVIGFGMTANAQTLNDTRSRMAWPIILILIFVVGYFLFRKGDGKDKKNKKDKLNNYLQERGFSNTELIYTAGAISPTGKWSKNWGLDNPTDDIFIGVKNGILSFFSGWGIGIKGIKDCEKIRHLFDIPINDVAEIEPQLKYESIVILNIYDKSDKRTMLCFCCWPYTKLNIELANILMSAFERIFETGSISEERISQINENIKEAIDAANKKLSINIIKGLGAAVLAGTLVVGGAAASGVSRWKKDL